MSEITTDAPRSLVKKLAAVMGEVDRIAKNGRNDHFNYDFATESDIAAAVRKEMAARSLLLVPNVTKTEWEQVARKNGTTKLCTLTVCYRLMDGDSGEQMEFTVLGQGEDSLDKATYKAMTGATKYALLKLFLIPTGDDPEKETEHRHVPGRQPAQDSAPAKSSAPPPENDLVVPFGKSKGKKLSQVSDADLSWLLGAFAKSVAAKDPKFHEKNVAQLAAAQAEAARRIGPSAGELKAPRNEAPKQAELPTDEEEEVVTPYARLVQLGRLHGLTQAQVISRASGVCSKTSGWTMEDVEKTATALKAVPVR